MKTKAGDSKFINFFKGFTFIELVISITIVAVLSVLWFVSYSKNLEDSRDSQRKSELSWVASGLKLHKTKRWEFPMPWNKFNITNIWYISAYQWKLDENLIISTIDKIPLDPFVNIPYTYSITSNKQEFQLVASLENNWINKSLIIGNYKTVSKNILPTIVLAMTYSWSVEVNSWIVIWATNRTKFIFDNSIHNLPYTFTYPFAPYTDGISFTGLVSEASSTWWQNSDYRSCFEIIGDWKFIGTWEYQINSWWTLISSGCTF